MNQEHFLGESCKRGLEFLKMILEWLSTIFVNGNPHNVSHKQDGKSNHWTLFLDNFNPLKDSRKTFGIMKGLAWLMINVCPLS